MSQTKSSDEKIADADAPVTFPIESGHLVMFARAIGDPDPAFDDRRVASGAAEVASMSPPPTFVQASYHYEPDFPLRPDPARPWFGINDVEAEDPGDSASPQMLHAEQHYSYHRHPRVGEVLRVSDRAGDSWHKEGRSGRLQFIEYIREYRDESGAVVITATSIGVVKEALDHSSEEGSA